MVNLTVDEFRKQFLDETLDFLNSLKMTEDNSSAASWELDRNKFFTDRDIDPANFNHIIYSHSNATDVSTDEVIDTGKSVPWKE